MEIESKDMKYKTNDDEIEAYLSRPKGDGKYPGVVLIHAIFGVDDHMKEVANRLASEGYVVLTPALFSSKKLSPTLTQQSIGVTLKFMMSIPPEKQRDQEYRNKEMEKLGPGEKEAVEKVNQVLFVNRPIDLFVEYLSSGVDYLASTGYTNGKMGSAGFCFGGGMSINLACTGKTDASIIFYGENPNPIDKIKNVKGAVMGLYGGEDARINAKIDELVKALVENKRPFTIKVFPGAYHGFFDDTKPMYNKQAAEDSWRMLLKFYKDNLSA
jgi:carboxymethylenebutenolidase